MGYNDQRQHADSPPTVKDLNFDAELPMDDPQTRAIRLMQPVHSVGISANAVNESSLFPAELQQSKQDF